MTRWTRIQSEFIAAWHTFVRQRTAVFFTFLFPVILIVIFGALIGTQSGGLFTEPPSYYVSGYLAVVVLFTPISRVSSMVARNRDNNRFEKLATTPLTQTDWFVAHTLVNIILVSIASGLVLGLVGVLTTAQFYPSLVLVPFTVLGVIVFCGIGAVLGRITGSRDGAIAASNTIGLPLLFLSETFVPSALLPAWFQPVIALSPLTYYARGVRGTITMGATWMNDLGILTVIAILFFVGGVIAVPWRE